jgi:hypothetical protein
MSVLKGETAIDGQNAKLFLEAICDQDHRALYIQRIQGSEYRPTAF